MVASQNGLSLGSAQKNVVKAFNQEQEVVPTQNQNIME